MRNPFKNFLKAGLLTMAFFGVAHAQDTNYMNPAQGAGYNNPGTAVTRPVVVSTPTHIQGCSAGLIYLGGQYLCRSNVPAGEAIVHAPAAVGCVSGNEPQCYTMVAIPVSSKGGGNGNAGNNGGMSGGYTGTDGQVHTDPSDSSPTCHCVSIGDTAENAAAKAATESAPPGEASASESNGSIGGDASNAGGYGSATNGSHDSDGGSDGGSGGGPGGGPG